jgi:hypothetical protein
MVNTYTHKTTNVYEATYVEILVYEDIKTKINYSSNMRRYECLLPCVLLSSRT